MNNISQQSSYTSYRSFLTLSSWFLALVLIVSSCSVKKETSNVKILSANHIVKEVEDNKFEFDNLEAKFNVNILDEKGRNEMGLKGQLRMQNDSVIWVSLSLKLGVEIARVMITEDSVKFINRTKKTYFATNIDGLDSIIENPLLLVQGLLVGNDFHIRDNKYQVEIENNSYNLETKPKHISKIGEEEFITKNIYITPESFKINKYEITTCFIREGKDKDAISCIKSCLSYDDFQNIDDKLIPSRIIFEDSSLDGIIEINYTEIKVGEKLEYPFNISKKYNKIISSW